MAEERPTSPAPPPQITQQVMVTRAPDFKARYSNYFRMRIGPGECIVTFCTITDAPVPQVSAIGLPQQITLLQEDFSLTVTWSILKSLVQQLDEVLQAVEQETGKQRPVRTSLTSEQAIQAYRNNLRQNLKDS